MNESPIGDPKEVLIALRSLFLISIHRCCANFGLVVFFKTPIIYWFAPWDLFGLVCCSWSWPTKNTLCPYKGWRYGYFCLKVSLNKHVHDTWPSFGLVYYSCPWPTKNTLSASKELRYGFFLSKIIIERACAYTWNLCNKIAKIRGGLYKGPTFKGCV